MNEHEPDAAAIIAAMERYHKIEIVNIDGAAAGFSDGVPAVALPTNQGFRLNSVKPLIDEWRQCPERRKGNAIMLSANSLIDHCNRFSCNDSVLFCDDGDRPSITVVYNYHQRTVLDDGDVNDDADPGFGDDRARYAFPISDEWKAWAGANGKSLDAIDFAEFLEERIMDVMPVDAEAKDDPTVQMLGGRLAGPDKIMDLSRGVKVFAVNDVETKLNLSSGEATLVSKEQHRDDKGNPVKLPNLFHIFVPIFSGGAAVKVLVRLRYRMRGGRVDWSFMLHNADRVMAEAVHADAQMVAEQTGLTLFFGRPE